MQYRPSLTSSRPSERHLAGNHQASTASVESCSRASPSAAAKVLWPLFAKAAAHISQPVQWRGGLLYEVYKQSGCGSDPQAYRSLFVSSAVGKSYHKIFRTKQQDKLGNVFHSFHMGARKGCPVTLPALYILSHVRRGNALRRSVATLYLDTEAAYYRIVRQLAFGNLTTDDAVVRVSSTLASTRMTSTRCSGK